MQEPHPERGGALSGASSLMRALVTGAAGFIGGHLTRALLAQGHSLVGLDDLSTGRLRNLPKESPRWRLLRGDVRDPVVCAEAIRGVDVVLHLAGLSSVPASLLDPEETLSVNVTGGLRILEAARSAGVRRVVYASSSSVYGDAQGLPQREDQLGQALSPYAASKAGFEHVAQAWTRSWGLHTLGLRFFNVFGPRQDPSGAYAAVVPRFVQAALDHTRPVIFGDGSHTRDFTYVDDVVQALLLAIDAPPQAAGQVVNVACGGRVSVLELWQTIARHTGAGLSPRFLPARVGDMPHSQADISRAARLLGYAPRVCFEEGVRRTVASAQARRAEEAA